MPRKFVHNLYYVIRRFDGTLPERKNTKKKLGKRTVSRKKGKTEKAQRLGRKTGDKKGESDDSPAIPDRSGRNSRHPWPPFGG